MSGCFGSPLPTGTGAGGGFAVERKDLHAWMSLLPLRALFQMRLSSNGFVSYRVGGEGETKRMPDPVQGTEM